VDKAPLAENLKLSSRVKFIEESAFALDPARVGRVDWLFSDVICYPERVLEVVRKWMEIGLVGKFVCSLKFQGPTDHAVVAEFGKIPGARLRHLFHNKHELTWTCYHEESKSRRKLPLRSCNLLRGC
jgi:23S rRNA (cytidine2498-2'-O)-methyltransferase